MLTFDVMHYLMHQRICGTEAAEADSGRGLQAEKRAEKDYGRQ